MWIDSDGVLIMVNELLFKKAIEGDKDSFIKLIEPIKENLYRVAFVY